MLRSTAGWIVNDKRVERIWRREGLKVPVKQSKQGRIWLSDGSCIRLRAERPNHVWSYDFVEDRTHDGRKYRMLNLIDEFTHECLVIRVERKLKSVDVIDVLSDRRPIRRRASSMTTNHNDTDFEPPHSSSQPIASSASFSSTATAPSTTSPIQGRSPKATPSPTSSTP
jgi:hypothetical protein